MKELNYSMKITTRWMTLDELQGTKTRIYFIDSSGTKDTTQFKYWQQCGLHFRYRHQLDNHNSWRHAPIYLEISRATSLWPDCNFVWYITMPEVNTDPSLGHFQNDGIVQPSLDFWRYLTTYYLDNIIGVELGGIGRCKITYKIPIYVLAAMWAL